MISVAVANLLIPEEPSALKVSVGKRSWELTRSETYDVSKKAILEGHQSAVTYFVECDEQRQEALSELIRLCLLASFLSGRAVSPRATTQMSDVMVLQFGEGFPRDRSDPGFGSLVGSQSAFVSNIESGLQTQTSAWTMEKMPLVIHHWLDALSCWSLEDLYLSATTVLQIIAATGRQPNVDETFRVGLDRASQRLGLRGLPQDVIRLRNDLIHDGTLFGPRFKAKDTQACWEVAGDVLNWIDEFVCQALSMQKPPKPRVDVTLPCPINAFSTP